MTRPDVGLRQRRLVGRRLRLEDTELATKYVFPFVGEDWTVRFAVLELLGAGPRILATAVRADGEDLRATATATDLGIIESVPQDTFDGLVHFDPWWTFRGASGVHRAWIERIVASNIARPFVREGRTHKVEDLLFGLDAKALEALTMKDDRFRAKTFRRGELDLSTLRRPPFR